MSLEATALLQMRQKLLKLEFGLQAVIQLSNKGNVVLEALHAETDPLKREKMMRALKAINNRILEFNKEPTLASEFNKSRRRLSHLFQNMVNGFAYTKALHDRDRNLVDLQFIEVNKSLCRLFGKNAKEINGASFQALFPDPSLADRLHTQLRPVLNSGKPIEFEEFFQTIDKWFVISAFSTDPGFLALLFYDITPRKLAEQELSKALDEAQRANLAKDYFLATLSHDIRTPLSTIQNTVNLLETANLDVQSMNHLRTISTASSHLLMMIEEILDVYASKKTNKKEELQPFAPQETIRSYTEDLSHAARLKGLDLRWDIDPALPPILLGDPVKLGRIIYNLIGNSIKFTQEGSVQASVTCITPEARETPEPYCRLLLTVSDTGVGIPLNSLDNIFTPYHQAGNMAPMNGVPSGSGLGLSITSDLVKRMGGEICVDSAVGQGTTFYCLLPFQVGQALKVQQPPGPQACPDSLRILVVDDNPLHADTTAALLRKIGCDIQVALNGASALILAREHHPKVVLLDLQLPDMTGFELTARLRQEQDAGTLPELLIIALTGHALPDHLEQCRAAGMNGHLAKPFDKAKFLVLVHELHAGSNGFSIKSAPGLETSVVAAPVQQDAGAPTLNLDALLKEFGEDRPTVDMILERFLESHLGPMEKLRRAVARGDLEAICFQAHYLKTSFLTVYATACAESASKVESASKKTNDTAHDATNIITRHMAELEQRLAACVTAVTAHLSTKDLP
ncbi:MAG: response regulator [Desulfovibrionaceae bacterium]